MSFNINVLFLLTQIGLIYTALPPIQKCKLSDSQCIKSSAQPVVPFLAAGIPELGTEPLDPLNVDSIKVDLSGLKLIIKDAEIKGLKNTVIDKISVNMDKKIIQLVYHFDITLRGKYKAAGKLLILPINGDGDTVIKLKNCQIQKEATFDIVKDQHGKDVIELKSYKYNYDVKDNAHFHLTNLFNGNKPLSDAMHTFMNGNWKTLTLEFGTPMFDKPVKKIFNSIKTFLKAQPLEEIANV